MSFTRKIARVKERPLQFTAIYGLLICCTTQSRWCSKLIRFRNNKFVLQSTDQTNKSSGAHYAAISSSIDRLDVRHCVINESLDKRKHKFLGRRYSLRFTKRKIENNERGSNRDTDLSREKKVSLSLNILPDIAMSK